MILIRVSFNPIMLFTEYCCNPHSLNYIFRSSAFSLNCNHTFFFHRFQQVSCLWIPEKWFLSAKSPAALLKPFTLSYRFNVFKVSWLNVSIWIFSFNLRCKISKGSSWSLQGNSSKLIFSLLIQALKIPVYLPLSLLYHFVCMLLIYINTVSEEIGRASCRERV